MVNFANISIYTYHKYSLCTHVFYVCILCVCFVSEPYALTLPVSGLSYVAELREFVIFYND